MNDKNDLVISHLELRRIVGILGMSLPFILAGGAWVIFGIGLQVSLSAYYNTPMRDVAVGLVFFITGFLWSYRGYDRGDAIAGRLAALFGWLYTIFPIAPIAAATDTITLLHNAFAAVFFVILIYITGFLFTKSFPDRPPTPQKLRRNLIYRISAVVMGVSLGLGLILYYLPVTAPFRPLLWGEVLAIEAFGISWFVKGEGILKDEERIR